MKAQPSLSNRRRKFSALGGVAALSTLALAGLGPAGSAWANPSGSGPAPTAIPAKDTVPGVDVFSSKVQSLGQFDYPDSFAGAVLTPAGVTDVYAVKAYDAALISAIEAINKTGYPINIIRVHRSYNQLNAINDALLKSNAHLQKIGIQLGVSSPDATSDSVVVSIREPGTAQIAALASATGARVTSSSYNGEVASVLTQMFGTGVTLQPNYASPVIAAGRTNDTSPFYGGDRIFRVSPSVDCTTGFNLIGNAHGTIFVYTAGHCGTGTWSTSATTVGKTATNYHSPSSTNDFMSIQANGVGVIWTSGTNTAHVGGRTLPAVGATVTFNGSVTGQITGNKVTQINATVYNIYDSIGDYFYTVTNQLIASNPSGTYICRGGDSGGPVYESTSPKITAVGDIVAYFQGSGAPGGGSACTITQINHILVVTNSGLQTS